MVTGTENIRVYWLDEFNAGVSHIEKTPIEIVISGDLAVETSSYVVTCMGLRLSEGLALKVGDIDATRHRVHVRDSKGNRDRFVPLPEATLCVLRRFWQTHRNPELLFPNRHGGLKAAHSALTPLDRGGVQSTLLPKWPSIAV